MIKTFKRSLCVFLSFTVLVFSCVFMPKQKAEALSEVGIIGTVGGLMGLALLLYGVSVSDPAVFDSNDIMTTASKGFLSAVGLGSFTYDSPISYAAFNASSWLAAAKDLADAAYSSGACTTEIAGPLPAPGTFYQQGDFTVLNTNFVGTRTFKDPDSSVSFSVTSSGTENLLYFFISCPIVTSHVYALSPVYLDDSSFKISAVNSRGDTSSISFQNKEYRSSSGKIYYTTAGFSPNYVPSCLSFPTSSLNHFNYADLCDFTYPSISADELLAHPVIPGACDVFNSSKSLDSYHVDSPGNDVLDLGNLLDKTGCESIDDVVSKVYEGDLTASDVIGGLDCRPYVDVDVDTGTIAIPNETTNSRPIALDQDLTIPSDIADTDTYIPLNPPADSDRTNRPSGSYTFPLSNFFPFCLPWDIYKVLSIFNTSPKAPVISIPLGSFFSDIPGVDKDTTDYICSIDLGDENFKKWFQILRLLESIGIIVGFVLISRYLIHGGD